MLDIGAESTLCTVAGPVELSLLLLLGRSSFPPLAKLVFSGGKLDLLDSNGRQQPEV